MEYFLLIYKFEDNMRKKVFNFQILLNLMKYQFNIQNN